MAVSRWRSPSLPAVSSSGSGLMTVGRVDANRLKQFDIVRCLKTFLASIFETAADCLNVERVVLRRKHAVPFAL
jgi:hypothetical protein